jgi:hypothetical protein
MDVHRINELLESAAYRVSFPYVLSIFSIACIDSSGSIENAIASFVSASRADDLVDYGPVVVELTSPEGQEVSAVAPLLRRWLFRPAEENPYDVAEQEVAFSQLQELLFEQALDTRIYPAIVSPTTWAEPNWDYVCFQCTGGRWLLSLGQTPT